MNTASKHRQGSLRLRLLFFYAVLALLPMPVCAQGTTTLAIYQFRPENIAAMGFESDVMLAIRNEMGNRDQIDLMAKRDMEDILARSDVAQEFSVSTAVKGGRLLSVRYVLAGSVSKEGGQINASLMLVDVNLGRQVESWNTAYRTRNEIDKAAATLVAEIVAATQSPAQVAEFQSLSAPLLTGGFLLSELAAKAALSQIQLNWQSESGSEALGYNIYRSQTKAGPYSFLGTTGETSYADQSVEAGITYYYQIGEVDIEGIEKRGADTAQAGLRALGANDISAPLIYGLTPLAGGVRLEVVDSLAKGTVQTARFKVYRSADDKDWVVIGEIPVPKDTRKVAAKEIKRYLFADTSLPDSAGVFHYAVSAVAADGSESVRSDRFEFAPAAIAPLQAVAQDLLRESRLSWRVAPLGKGYRIYRRENEQPWLHVGEVQGLQSTSFTDKEGLLDGQQYQYSYAVFDDDSESRRSASVDIKTKQPLPAPALITSNSVQARQVSLEWQAVADPDLKSYVIYRADYSDAEHVDMTPVAEVNFDAGLRYIDTGETSPLRDGARYHYAVASRNRLDGEGPMSMTIVAQTKHLPAPVVGVSLAAEKTALRLTWQYAPSDVESYIISRRWEEEEWQELARVDAAAREYVDTVLRPYAMVSYQVVVVDKTDLASVGVSTEQQVSPLQLALKLGPQPLLRRVELSWNQQALVDGYQIRRRKLPAGEWQKIATVSAPNASSYVDETGLEDGLEYAYAVSPLVGDRALGESNIASSKTKLVVAPGQITASRDKARQITLQWLNAEDEDIAAYVVYRGRGVVSRDEMTLYAEVEVAGAGVEFVDRGSSGGPLEHGVEYSYAIAAKNVLGGIGAAGAVVVGGSKPPPEPIYNFVAFGENAQVRLSWDYDVAQNVAEYQVFGRNSAAEWDLLASLDSGQRSFVDKDLKPFVQLQYRVLVKDVDDLFSKEVISDEISSPAAIELQVLADKAVRQVELSWNPQFHIDGFVLQRRAAGAQAWSDIKVLRDGNATSYVDKKRLVDSTDYEYRLFAVDDSEQLGESNTIVAHTLDLPVAPKNIVAQGGLVGQVRLAWQEGELPGIGGYTIYRVDDGELKKLASVSGADKTSYLDAGASLQPGSDYSYAIATYNTYRVEGERSELVTATTKHLPAPVSGVSVTRDGGEVTLSWDTNPEQDIDHYIVARSTRSTRGSCSNFSDIAQIPAREAVFRDRETRPNSRYCYRVTAVDDSALKGLHSTEVEVLTPAVVSIE